MSVGENFIGYTVLDSGGMSFTMCRFPGGGRPLVTLYALVDESFQQGALDDLLPSAHEDAR